MKPDHCWSPATVSVHHEREARRVVENKVRVGILDEVTWPTQWCSCSFFIGKQGAPGKLRMVTDFKAVNKVLRRPGWLFPSAEKVRKSLDPRDRCFLKVDLVEGYHQVEIGKEDRDLTAKLLPWGKYRYTCLPMGLCPSSDHFCQRTDDAIRTVIGVLKIVDDRLGGASDVPALRKKLVELLMVCRKYDLKISRRKFDLATKLSFAGFVMDASSGEVVVSPDPARLEAIRLMDIPRNKKQVRKFIGMVCTIDSWCPDISAKSNMLRTLSNKNTKFTWLPEHEEEWTLSG